MNCPNCGAPMRRKRCMYCGTEMDDAPEIASDYREQKEWRYRQSSPVEYPIIGYLNNKPVYYVYDPRVVPENPEDGVVIYNDYSHPLMYRDGRWEKFDCDLMQNERFLVARW